MPYVLSVHDQMDFFVDGNHQFARRDVVASGNVVLRIEPEEIRVALIDFFGMESTELSVRPGIAKIKSELPGLHLNWNRVRRCRLKVDLRPGLGSKGSECNRLGAYQQDRCNHKVFCASGKVLQRTVLPTAKLPHEKTEHEFGAKERQARFDHGLVKLLVD